jgi:hypothetical protein
MLTEDECVVIQRQLGGEYVKSKSGYDCYLSIGNIFLPSLDSGCGSAAAAVDTTFNHTGFIWLPRRALCVTARARKLPVPDLGNSPPKWRSSARKFG